MSNLTFCQDYVELAGDIAAIGKLFLIVALPLGIASALVEMILRFRQAPGPDTVPNPGPLKDLIDALKGLIEALGKAPAWIAFFGIGILLFWAAGSTIPDECKPDMKLPYARSSTGTGTTGAKPGQSNPATKGDGAAQGNRTGG